MKLINLTPHALNVLDLDGSRLLVLEPEVTPARVTAKYIEVGPLTIEGATVPLTKVEYGQVTGLPAPDIDRMYVVSMMVANAVWSPERHDLLVPGDLVRDEKGFIIGCKGLVPASTFKTTS